MIPLNKPGSIENKEKYDYVAGHFGNLHAYILSNAGDGLNLAYRRLYKERGSLRVAVSPMACVLAIYPIIQNGHVPVFIDVDADTFNLNAKRLIERDDIDAVEVIHLAGNPNEMDVICKWAEENKKPIIEDCAQALGSTYNGIDVGNFGDYASFSLIKNLHIMIGGLFLSKYEFNAKFIPTISSMILGYRELKRFLESHSDHNRYNIFNYLYYSLLRLKEHSAQEPSSNIHSLTERRANKIRKELCKIVELNKKRVENAKYIIEHVDSTKYLVQKGLPKGETNRNRLLFKISEPKAKETIMTLRSKGIAANNFTQNYLFGYQQPVSCDKLLKRYYTAEELKVFDTLYDNIIAVPCSPFLRKDELDYIIDKMNEMK